MMKYQILTHNLYNRKSNLLQMKLRISKRKKSMLLTVVASLVIGSAIGILGSVLFMV